MFLTPFPAVISLIRQEYKSSDSRASESYQTLTTTTTCGALSSGSSSSIINIKNPEDCINPPSHNVANGEIPKPSRYDAGASRFGSQDVRQMDRNGSLKAVDVRPKLRDSVPGGDQRKVGVKIEKLGKYEQWKVRTHFIST